MKSPFTGRTVAALCLLSLSAGILPASAQTDAAPPAAADASDNSGTLALGGQVVLRLRAAAAGLSPDQRVAAITERLQRVLGVPNIKPSDVVVYVPPPRPGQNQAPVIYALGRRLITVDAATVQAAGGGKPLLLASAWAKRLQQILPRVDWRPSNEPETVVPAHPPLRVTHDLAQVGGDVGDVRLYDKLVIRLRGPQTGGWTAAERADALTTRLDRVARTLDRNDPNAVAVTPHTPGDPRGPVDLTVGGQMIVTVDAAQAKAAGVATPAALAGAWAKNIRGVLGMNVTPAAATPSTTPTTPGPAPSPPPTSAP